MLTRGWWVLIWWAITPISLGKSNVIIIKDAASTFTYIGLLIYPMFQMLVKASMVGINVWNDHMTYQHYVQYKKTIAKRCWNSQLHYNWWWQDSTMWYHINLLPTPINNFNNEMKNKENEEEKGWYQKFICKACSDPYIYISTYLSTYIYIYMCMYI